VDQSEVEKLIGELETALDRLRSLYEQYFVGIERIEPGVPRKDVERRIYVLRREQIRNTALRFRFQMVLQKFNTYQTHWQRVCREIENGTYKRHIMRAERRFGSSRPPRRRTSMPPPPLPEPGAPPPTDVAAQLAALDSDFAPASFDVDVQIDTPRPSSRPPRPTPRPPAGAPAPPRPVAPGQPVWKKVGAPAEAPGSPPAAPPGRVGPPPPPQGAPRAVPPPAPRPPLPAPGAQRPPPPAPAQQHPPQPVPPASRAAAPPPPVQRPGAPLGGAPPPRPPSAPEPRGPSAPEARAPEARRTAPATPSPPPPEAAPPRPPPPRPSLSVAPPRPAPASSDLSEKRLRQIYVEYVDAKRRQNESTAAITYQSVAKSLRESGDKLRQKHGKAVDFEVTVKDGKTVLRPVLK
jgi:hypothetical protein